MNTTNSSLAERIQTTLKGIVKDTEFADGTIELKSGSQPDDGMNGELISAKIKTIDNETELNLLCKLPVSNEYRRKQFNNDAMFEREVYFYDKLLPTFIEFQREKCVAKVDQFRAYAKCYSALHVAKNGNCAIIMEDLRSTGFRMADKAKPTTIANIRLVLREIAKFHALSFALKDQRPEVFADFEKLTDITNVSLQSMIIRKIFDRCFERTMSALHNSHHKEVISKFRTNFLKYMMSCANEKAAGKFAVIIHNDLWINNILYRFNENNVSEDVRFVDWQLIAYMSPALDLLLHIFTTTDKPIRDAEYMNLLRHYHDSLSHMLKQLGSDPNKVFTFDNLLDEMKRCGNFGILAAPFMISFSLADSSENDDHNDGLITGLSERAQIEFEERINGVIGDLVDLGYFTELD